MNGFTVDHGRLLFNGVEIASDIDGGEGLHIKPPRDLYFNRQLIVSGNPNNQVGIYDDGLNAYFDGIKLGVNSGVNLEELTPLGYWIAPLQEDANAIKSRTYEEWIAAYDDLVAIDPKLTKHRYEDALGEPITNSVEAGSYELFHYKFEPENYTKTLFLVASIHGTERDSRVTLYRMIDILINKRDQFGYTAWREVYEKCRIIIIPAASPYGIDNTVSPIPHWGETGKITLNGTYDFIHHKQASTGYAGVLPFEVAETQHVRDTFNNYGAQNIDYAVDYHDGAGIADHYWSSYQVDSPSRLPIMSSIYEMLERHDVPLGEAVLGRSKDTSAFGTASSWFGKTMGVPASTNEWLGHFFGADYQREHMTHSLEVRANLVFMALRNDVKGWQVHEPANARYFHFDFPRAFTRKGMQPDTYITVKDVEILANWDSLTLENPSKITKSVSLGLNLAGEAVHTYTFGSGAKKVLFVGGAMRYGARLYAQDRFGAEHRIDTYAMYLLIEYLCNDYIVEQSKFLQDLRDNYTIVCLPFIDNYAVDNVELGAAGINNAAASKGRWMLDSSNKAVPTVGEHGEDNHAVKIIKKLIDDNPDLKCIVSGGEIMTDSLGNDQLQYSTDYQTQIITPRNQVLGVMDYAEHLTNNRSELVSVEKTDGLTFADYAYDNFSILAYFVQLKVSDRYLALADYHTLNENLYMHSNYEAGRRMANIANLFLM